MSAHDNLELWNQVCETDPNYLKDFLRPGGFKGKAIDAMYLIRKATELWGPMGAAWKAEEVERVIVDGAWFIRVRVTYPTAAHGDGAVEQWGGTAFLNKRKDGTPWTDDEAPKKSFTDGLSKCLSWLGFAADVHTGLYDDNKYMSEMRQKYGQGKNNKKPTNPSPPEGEKPGSDPPAAGNGKASGKRMWWDALAAKIRPYQGVEMPNPKEELPAVDAMVRRTVERSKEDVDIKTLLNDINAPPWFVLAEFIQKCHPSEATYIVTGQGETK